MTSLNSTVTNRPFFRPWDRWIAVSAAWQTYRCIRQQQKALRIMANLPPRLIRDIGFDPENVYDAAHLSLHDIEMHKYHCAGLWR